MSENNKNLIKYITEPFKKYGAKNGLGVLLLKVKNSYIYRKNQWDHDIRLAQKVLRSGSWSKSPYQSELLNNFTSSFVRFHKGEYGLCTSNGTVALSVILKACGIKYGDEILMPAITFHSTASVALELGIVPHFVDVDKKNLCINPEKIEEKITKKTKAIVVVHLGAMVADLDKIESICKKHNLIMIEDCAHAHGAMWGDRGVGTYGDFSFFSFQSSKLINCGEGGFIMTKKHDHWKHCLSYVNCGRNSEPFSILGVNHRLTEIQVSILLESLKKFETKVEMIDSNTNFFSEEISKIKGIEILSKNSKHTRQTGYFYAFRINDEVLNLKTRSRIVEECCSRGLQCAEVLYPPVYLTREFGWKNSPIAVDYSSTKCVESEKAFEKNIIWINHQFFSRSRSDIKYGVNILNKVLKETK